MKKILLSQRVDVIERYKERRDAMDQRWPCLLYEAGFIGLPVFNHAETLIAALKSTQFDGILLSGGNSHAEYGGNAPERDNADKILLSHAAEKKIPLLGVCRGMQSIVLYFGGSLHKVSAHVSVRHDIGAGRNVNSYHEYSPELLPDALEALGKSGDGEIEYIKHKSLPITGIMWHPERETPFSSGDINLIKTVFEGKQ